MSDKIFWEHEYKDLKRETFGKPSKEIINIVDNLSKNSTVLDMGAGDGRNSIFISKYGFEVDAFDILQSGIDKLNYIAKYNKLTINASVDDACSFRYTKKYDLIIAHGLLQFIDKKSQRYVIEKMKENTKVGGYNIIAVFTDEEPIPDDLKESMIGIFKEREIRDYYIDWDILMFESSKFNDEHIGGIKHRHAMNKLVAKKRNNVDER
ncbi:MAG: methyltransferase domain-containing protein [Paraclostridium sp.]